VGSPSAVGRVARPDQSAVSVRADRCWIVWLDRTARRNNRKRADLIAEALRRFAAAQGLEAPPPRVTPPPLRRHRADSSRISLENN
jgi:hypothetical protein